jgi:hypothetical protein
VITSAPLATACPVLPACCCGRATDAAGSVIAAADVLTFLADLRDALAACLDELEAYAATMTLPGEHVPLALDHGIATYAASLAWIKRTINALSREPARTPTAE